MPKEHDFLNFVAFWDTLSNTNISITVWVREDFRA